MTSVAGNPIEALLRDLGETEFRIRADGTITCGHGWRHSSKSNTCLAIWPEKGSWRCFSCQKGGTLADLLVDAGRAAHYTDGWETLASYGIYRRGRNANGNGHNGNGHNGHESTPFDHSRPEIIINNRQLPDLAKDIWDAVKAYNDRRPTYFRRDGLIARVVPSDETGPRQDVVGPTELRYIATHAAQFYTVNADGETRSTWPTKDVFEHMLAHPAPPLPVLNGLARAPFVAPGGRLVLTDGYDRATGIYLALPHVLRGLDIPVAPTRKQVKQALGTFEELVGDFPFVDTSDFANALAKTLNPFVRPYYDDLSPIWAVTAPTPRSGKGLLDNATAMPFLGRRVAEIVLPRGMGSDEELEKKLTSLFRQGQDFICWSNVEGVINHPVLAMAVTADPYQGRILGSSNAPQYRNRVNWSMTGNNPTFGGDVPGRIVPIRLDPDHEFPEQRTGFKYPGKKLLRHILDNRRRIVTDLLTLVQAWIAEGMPKGPQTLGSFEACTETLGGILSVIEVPGFLQDREKYTQTADLERSRWVAFVLVWAETYGVDTHVPSRDLFDMARDREVLPVDVNPDKGELSARSTFGRRLMEKRNRIYAGLRIDLVGDDPAHGGRKYALRETGSSDLLRPSPTFDDKRSEATEQSTTTDSDLSDLSDLANRARARRMRAHARVEGTLQRSERSDAPAFSSPSSAAQVPTLAEAKVGKAITDPAEARALAWQLANAPYVGIDLETTGLDPHEDRARLLALATEDGAWVVDLATVPIETLNPVLLGGPLKIAHNAKFDCRFIMAAGVPRVGPWWDTMLADQMLRNANFGRKLSDLAKEYLGKDMDKTLQKSDFSAEITAEQVEYAREDAAVLIPLYAHLYYALKDAGMDKVADVEMRALPAIAAMEHAGVAFDLDAWTALAVDAEAKRDALRQHMEELVLAQLGANDLLGEHRIDWESVQQVSELFKALGLDVADTRQETLERVRDAHPIVPLFMEYREASKRAGTYGKDWLKFVNPRTGRIHADWKPIGSEPGRMACKNPNLQNLPRDPRYRDCFIPRGGRVLVKADYSQIELRIIAQMSQDPRMLKAFAEGGDLHQLTAALVMGKRPEEVTKEERQMAKAVNFGLIYGMGAQGLANYAANSYGVTLTLEQAQRFRQRYFEAFAAVRRWHKRHERDKETRTLWGRRRVLRPDAFSTERYNSPVQGTGADLLKLALAHLWETEPPPGTLIVSVVHDEIQVEADADRVEQAEQWLTAAMENAAKEMLDVPVVVEVTRYANK